MRCCQFHIHKGVLVEWQAEEQPCPLCEALRQLAEALAQLALATTWEEPDDGGCERVEDRRAHMVPGGQR